MLDKLEGWTKKKGGMRFPSEKSLMMFECTVGANPVQILKF